MKKLLAAIALLALVSGQAHAQPYPNKPIRWLIPFSAGGPTDVLARAIAPKLSESLGVPVIVENKVGAGGSLAMDAVAKSAPDGYTIGMGHSGTQSINPHLYSKLPYDSLKDFAPVTPVVSYVNVLVVNPNVPAKTVAELVAYAKVNPQKVSFASGGTGATNHLSGELLKAVTGAPMLHVPYKGSAPALVDVMSGNATCMFDILVTSLPQIRAGKVRALAVTSAKRSGYAPDIPTMRESGIEGYEEAGSDLWFGVLGPAGTPKPIVDRLNAELVKALRDPQIAPRLESLGVAIIADSPEQFTSYIASESQKWRKVVVASGAKAD